MMKRGVWIFGGVLVVLGGLAGGRSVAQQNGRPPQTVESLAAPAQEVSPGATVVHPTNPNVRWIYNVSMHFKIPGVILNLELNKEGTPVKKGEELCRLDDREARLQHKIAQAKAEDNTDILVNRAQFRVSEEEFKSADMLRRQNPAWVAREEWNLKAAKVDVARYQIEQARMKQSIAGLESEVAAQHVDDHILKAPWDGIITEVFKQEGDYVDPQSAGPVVRVSRLDVLQVEGTVSVEDGLRIHEGQPVLVTAKALKGQVFKGKVRFVDREVEPVSQTVRVRTEIQNPDGKLLPGLAADMAIYVSGQPEESHAAREVGQPR